jgi:hypothetical protein
MPTTVSEFEDDTGFERLILDRATPLLPRSENGSVIDLRSVGSTGTDVTPVTVSISAGDSSRSPNDELSMDDLRPFIFGAAWKVLDFLVELSFEMNDVPPDRRGREYTIAKKAGEAARGLVDPVAPFDSHAPLWSRLLHVYSSTKELRHSLVHRRFKVDPDTGEVTGEPRPGESARPLTAAEQTDFCRAAQGVAQAVIDRTLSTRRANQLGWSLDQLSAHHGQPLLGTEAVHGVIPTVLVSAGNLHEITVVSSEILAHAQQAVGGVSHFDLMLCLPDGRLLTGALEDAPRQPVTFQVDEPPTWLQWK